MKKYLSVILLVFLLCFVVGCQQEAEKPSVDIAAEREAVSQATAAWINANSSKDLDAMLALVADDAIFSRFGAEFRNKTQVGETWASELSKGYSYTCYAPEKLEVSASGDLAYAVQRFDYTRVVEGEAKTSKSTFTSVWKKQADGSWKIVSW